MKAAVVGAHTVLGSGVVTALERRGIHSVAIMPKLCALAGEGQIIIKDYAELTAEDLPCLFLISPRFQVICCRFGMSWSC